MPDDPFAHLAGAHFTAGESAEYLEVTEGELQRYVAAGRLHPTADQTFSVPELKALKKQLKSADFDMAINKEYSEPRSQAFRPVSGQ